MNVLDILPIVILALPIPFQLHIVPELAKRKKKTILALWTTCTIGHLICICYITGEIIQFFSLPPNIGFYVLEEEIIFCGLIISYINTQILKGYRTLFPNLKLNRIKWLRMYLFGGYLVRLVFSIGPYLFGFKLDYSGTGIESTLYYCYLVSSYSWLFVCVMYDNIQCVYLTYKEEDSTDLLLIRQLE